MSVYSIACRNRYVRFRRSVVATKEFNADRVVFEQTYAALAHHVQNANHQRLQTVSLWTLQLTAQGVRCRSSLPLRSSLTLFSCSSGLGGVQEPVGTVLRRKWTDSILLVFTPCCDEHTILYALPFVRFRSRLQLLLSSNSHRALSMGAIKLDRFSHKPLRTSTSSSPSSSTDSLLEEADDPLDTPPPRRARKRVFALLMIPLLLLATIPVYRIFDPSPFSSSSATTERIQEVTREAGVPQRVVEWSKEDLELRKYVWEAPEPHESLLKIVAGLTDVRSLCFPTAARQQKS